MWMVKERSDGINMNTLGHKCSLLNTHAFLNIQLSHSSNGHQGNQINTKENRRMNVKKYAL